MVCVPAVNPLAVKVTTPVLESEPAPRVVLPSWKVTVPVGAKPEAGVTVAVKVTLDKTLEGLRDEVTTVLVTAGLMV